MISTAVKQKLLFNKLNLPREVKKVEAFRTEVWTSDLSEVKGIGEATKVKLIEAGVVTQEQLKTLSEEQLKAIITNPLSLKGILNFING